MMANSLALWADFAVTLIGFLALLTAWLTIRAVTRGDTEAFAFGHGRLENVSSMGIAGMMILSFLMIVGIAVWKFMNPGPSSGFGIIMGLACNGAYVLINGWVYSRNLVL
jgi:divalent metal cation (Fe/Co/Zn/Cd) transporter